MVRKGYRNEAEQSPAPQVLTGNAVRTRRGLATGETQFNPKQLENYDWPVFLLRLATTTAKIRARRDTVSSI